MQNKVYGTANLNTGKITVNKSMNRSGMEYADTAIHEMNHINNPKMSERGIIKKTEKDLQSYLSII